MSTPVGVAAVPPSADFTLSKGSGHVDAFNQAVQNMKEQEN